LKLRVQNNSSISWQLTIGTKIGSRVMVLQNCYGTENACQPSTEWLQIFYQRELTITCQPIHKNNCHGPCNKLSLQLSKATQIYPQLLGASTPILDIGASVTSIKKIW
jgi:hypothetical protein